MALSGCELIIDAKECDGILDNKKVIETFIEDLCKLGKMKRVGDMIAEYFPYTPYNIEKDLCGYSIVQIISLSSISLHIAEISKTVFFNFFTCGDFDEDEVINLFKSYFKPKAIKKVNLKRNLDF